MKKNEEIWIIVADIYVYNIYSENMRIRKIIVSF